MTNTLPSKNGNMQRRRRSGRESAVGLQRHKRTATDVVLALITPLLGQEFPGSLRACVIRSTAGCATASRPRSPPLARRRANSIACKRSASRPPG